MKIKVVHNEVNLRRMFAKQLIIDNPATCASLLSRFRQIEMNGMASIH